MQKLENFGMDGDNSRIEADPNSSSDSTQTDFAHSRKNLNADSLKKLSLQAQLLNQIAAVHEVTPDGKITSANIIMSIKTGYSEAELIGAGHHTFCPDLEPGGSWVELHKPVESGEFLVGETLNRTADGSDLWLSTTIAPIRDYDGVVAGYYCVSTDVTESRKLREEFRRSGKLMQLGQLTATVAHEIRNPLGAIRTAKFVLERKLEGKVEGVEAQLERINNGIRRCDKIITELLDFSRKKTLNTTTVSVDNWVADIIEEERGNLVGAPDLVCDFTLGDANASFDVDQIRQVLVNLLSNAAEAAAEKTKNDETSDYKAQITVTTKLVGEHVHIVVSDNGPGIEPKNLKRIREPLFTTKSFGVGLGIPAIEKILENHGGVLAIESELGQGAKITASFLKDAV